MIGATLRARRGPPLTALVLLAVAALGVAAWATLGARGWAIFSVLPGAIGAVLLVQRPRAFHADLSATGLQVYSAEESIPYSHITRIWSNVPASQSATIYMFHIGGLLVIPQCEGIDSEELLTFLRSAARPVEVSSTHSAVAAYLQSQSSTFGLENISAYNARPVFHEKKSRTVLAVLLTTLAVAFAWIVIGVSSRHDDWAGAGGLLFGVSLIGLLFWFLASHREDAAYGIKNWRESSLVISPMGLALAQGDLVGELRWAELRSVKLRGGSAPRNRRIELSVEGAQIHIRDIYDGPLAEIYRQIDDYWRAG